MNVNRGSLSEAILTVLEKAVDTSLRFEDFVNKTHLYAYSDRWQKNLAKSALSKAISRLKMKGVIEEVKVDNRLIIQLTEVGKDFLEERHPSNEWDGVWRIVIFDIPEQKRIVRNLFRRNLKKWGFSQFQKSVWVSKKNVFDKLNKYIDDLGIAQYVSVIEADRVSSNLER